MSAAEFAFNFLSFRHTGYSVCSSSNPGAFNSRNAPRSATHAPQKTNTPHPPPPSPSETVRAEIENKILVSTTAQRSVQEWMQNAQYKRHLSRLKSHLGQLKATYVMVLFGRDPLRKCSQKHQRLKAERTVPAFHRLLKTPNPIALTSVRSYMHLLG